ncbi:MAG: hypothetical protein JXA71_06820 [Chitinispirillaceae bacterium]|nr:hypothetical protein [Chitinispirillaceae bacterium]
MDLYPISMHTKPLLTRTADPYKNTKVEVFMLNMKWCAFLATVSLFFPSASFAQWVPASNVPPMQPVRSLAANGTAIFAGSEGQGIFRSLDNGVHWTAVNTRLTNHDVRALAISGTSIFAGTNGGGVFLSTDNGATWNVKNNGLTGYSVTSFAINGINIFAGTSVNGVFLSTDNGASWNAVSSGLTVLCRQQIMAVFLPKIG